MNTFFFRSTQKVFFLPIFLLGIILAAGCSSTKRATSAEKADEKAESLNESVLMSGLMEKIIDEDWLQARARVSADLNGDKYDVTANIYYQKNEVIMVSARMLGFELARLFITPDSALILSRLDRTYLSYDMDQLGRLVGFPVDMSIVENMLLGNPYLGDDIQWRAGESGEKVRLQTAKGSIVAENQIDLPDFKLSRAIFQDRENQRTLNSLFSQYQPYKDNNFFSYFRTYELNSAADGDMYLEIRFTSIEWDKPFNVDISIPPRYSKMF